MSEREENQRSNLPAFVKLLGATVVITLVCGSGLVAAIVEGNLIGFITWVIVAHVVGKIVWQLC